MFTKGMFFFLTLASTQNDAKKKIFFQNTRQYGEKC